MRQLSLFEALCVSDPLKSAITAPDQLEVYDFFAGAGGFSTGAALAGCRVAYACDSCPLALETHRRNHPKTEHQCLSLPSAEAISKLPTDGRRFHVHCSPPCTRFSRMNEVNAVVGNKGASGIEDATHLVEWSLRTMLESQCTSWSLEQVGTIEVIAILKRMRKEYPGRIAYAVIDFALLGVPQNRKRLLAASPPLLARLLRKCSDKRHRSVKEVIDAPRGTHVRHGRSETRSRPRLNRKAGETKMIYQRAGWHDHCRPIHKIGHTVRGRHAPTWVTIFEGKAVSHTVMAPPEIAALQTFPQGYKLPERKSDAYLQVGNAVPPLVAKLLLM